MTEKERRATRARHINERKSERDIDYSTYDTEKDCDRWWFGGLAFFGFMAAVFPYIAEAVLL